VETWGEGLEDVKRGFWGGAEVEVVAIEEAPAIVEFIKRWLKIGFPESEVLEKAGKIVSCALSHLSKRVVHAGLEVVKENGL